MAPMEDGPNHMFVLDFMVTEEGLSLGYIVFRAMNMFHGLSVPDPAVFRSVRYLKTILCVGGHHQPHQSSSPND